MAADWHVFMIAVGGASRFFDSDNSFDNDTVQGILRTHHALTRVGLPEIHVIHSETIECPLLPEISSYRIRFGSELDLLISALEMAVKLYSERDQRFLILRPGLDLFGQLPQYLEYSIPVDTVGVYLPHVPDRVASIETHQGTRHWHDKRAGWHRVELDNTFVAGRCLAFNNLTARLIHSQLVDGRLLDTCPPQISAAIGHIVSNRFGTPCYLHNPSLLQADSVAPDRYASNFVGCDTFVRRRELLRWAQSNDRNGRKRSQPSR